MSPRAARVSACVVALVTTVVTLSAATGGGLGSINRSDIKEWLSYIASDELRGRALYSIGLGLAAAYIGEHLRTWGATPAGAPGSYLQAVPVLDVIATSHSTLTVEVGGQTKTFADGSGVTFPKRQGGKRRFTIDRVEFAGYGLDAPRAHHVDIGRKDVKGAAVVWLGAQGPKDVPDARYAALLAGRSQYATDQLQAAASIGPERAGRTEPAPHADSPVRSGASDIHDSPDFTTTERLDAPEAPNATASDAFFAFLFSHAPTKYDELKRKADARAPLPSFRLDGVKLTFNLDDDYQIVRTRITHNVAAIVEGSDPQLRNTYVAFGAHYDHIGAEYVASTWGQGVGGTNGAGPSGPGAEGERIWNGADDDGSGTVAVMALAKAFAEGPRPKRSLLFVWHTGEERGRLGSLFFADHPIVPLSSIAAELNIDMIGRNRNDNPTESNTVYAVGSDRISSELHNLNQAANRELPRPMLLNYELNDPGDPEQLYFRSDHYSYAAKGIPVVFFTTGLHPDYHMKTDTISKIEFEKMTRITQLVYETGWRVANLDHFPVRDNKGARAK